MNDFLSFRTMVTPIIIKIVSWIGVGRTALSFGKGAGFGIGLAFLGPVFFPILGYGASQYVGPAAAPGGAVARA